MSSKTGIILFFVVIVCIGGVLLTRDTEPDKEEVKPAVQQPETAISKLDSTESENSSAKGRGNGFNGNEISAAI